MTLLGVDVGGTFTDAALLVDGRIHTAKAPTTTDQAEGVIEAVEAALAEAGVEADAVEGFAHGMTVGTNALLAERGARTALIATAGFTDLLEIARQDRPSLYRLCEARAEPLVGDELRFGAAERIGPTEVVRELSAEAAEELVAEVAEAEPESVAICLLFAYREPAHERLIAERLRERLPDLHVSVSHEVLPRFREYERCSTTAIDAYLSPLLGR
ncbi:MAG: hydantoinase/oxoprolinase N-terminal domain-containing protein, partial [Solirubrobacteraceae bacterium]